MYMQTIIQYCIELTLIKSTYEAPDSSTVTSKVLSAGSEGSAGLQPLKAHTNTGIYSILKYLQKNSHSHSHSQNKTAKMHFLTL